MTDSHSDAHADDPETQRAAAIAALRHEFAAGLTERVSVMRDALARIEQRDDPQPRVVLHRQAHSLKGTGAAYGARAVAECARILEARARAWPATGSVAAAELALAREDLMRLAAAVAAYQAAVGAEGAA